MPDGVSPVAVARAWNRRWASRSRWRRRCRSWWGACRRWATIVALVFLLALSRFALGLAALGFGAVRLRAWRRAGSRWWPRWSSRRCCHRAARSRRRSGAARIWPRLRTCPSAWPGCWRSARSSGVLAETARVPVASQETHYELTMIHEGLSLEYAGWQLAVVQAAAYVRQLSFLLLAALLLPGDALWALAAWVVGLAVSVTVVETCSRRCGCSRFRSCSRARSCLRVRASRCASLGRRSDGRRDAAARRRLLLLTTRTTQMLIGYVVLAVTVSVFVAPAALVSPLSIVLFVVSALLKVVAAPFGILAFVRAIPRPATCGRR